MNKVKIAGAVLELHQGNIADQDCDIIVNAANNHFWMGSGVAGALKKAGGRDIEDEATAKGPVEPGHCVVTGPGKLKCKAIIHAAVMGQDLHTNRELVQKSLLSALTVANELQAESLALPALGTGVGAFNIHEAAKLHIDMCIEHLLKGSSIEILRLILFDDMAFSAFSSRLHNIFHK